MAFFEAADAEAICEAVRRPTMRFVQVKSAEQQQGRLMQHRTDSAAGTAQKFHLARGRHDGVDFRFSSGKHVIARSRSPLETNA